MLTAKRKGAFDPDNPPLTAKQLSGLGPAPERHKEIWRSAQKAARGRPPSDHPKEQVTLRIDGDVLEHYKAGGAGWQSRINATLRKAAKL